MMHTIALDSESKTFLYYSSFSIKYNNDIKSTSVLCISTELNSFVEANLNWWNIQMSAASKVLVKTWADSCTTWEKLKSSY